VQKLLYIGCINLHTGCTAVKEIRLKWPFLAQKRGASVHPMYEKVAPAGNEPFLQSIDFHLIIVPPKSAGAIGGAKIEHVMF
jgi:hypothetical protein